MVEITKERANELGLLVDKESCADCICCIEKNNTLCCDELGITIDEIIGQNKECPELDQQRLFVEMTGEEYDAYRHNRLRIKS